MPPPKVRSLPDQRGWTALQVAHYMGMSEQWFSLHHADLTKQHEFPRPSPLTGRYDAKAVSLWYDKHSGLLPETAITDPAAGWRKGLKALKDKHGPAH